MCEAVFLSSVSVLCELCVTFPPVPEEASVPGGVPGDQKAQKVVTKYVGCCARAAAARTAAAATTSDGQKACRLFDYRFPLGPQLCCQASIAVGSLDPDDASVHDLGGLALNGLQRTQQHARLCSRNAHPTSRGWSGALFPWAYLRRHSDFATQLRQLSSWPIPVCYLS
jgi:hypothetical protein